MALEDKVKEIIVEQLGVSAEQVTIEASFIEDLGADSLDTVELVMAFEEEFSAEIPDEDAEKLTTVGFGDVTPGLQSEDFRRYSGRWPEPAAQAAGPAGPDRRAARLEPDRRPA